MKKAVLVLGISSVFIGCQAPQKKAQTQSANLVKTAKVLEMERKIKAREEEIQELKDRNRVMNAIQVQNKKSAPAAASAARPASSKIEINPVLSVIPKTESELYQEIQQNYDRNNEIGFHARVQAFRKKFPKSHLTDEVLYLSGLMALSNKNYGASLKYFNQIQKEYPTSAKASAAFFAKGVALKRMNLSDQARNVFTQVKKKYPGSVEATRADTELKILKK